MKKGIKIFLGIIILVIAIVVGGLSTIIIYHKTYKVKGVKESIINNTGIIQAEGRGLYDENGKEIIFRGVNLGGWFCTESWLEPYAVVDPVYETRDGETRPVYYTTNWQGTVLDDKLSQDEMIRGIKSNTNLTGLTVEQVLDKFYDNWISEEDIKAIKSMGLNQVRIPFGWRMFLNDDYSVRSDINESTKYLTRCIDWCKKYGLYVVLDLHACPATQNAYEHGGSIEWVESDPGKKYVKLWNDEDAIKATIKIWELLSDKYNTAEYKNTICMYDLMNEPRNVSGSTDKQCWDVFDRIYDAIRAKNDNHVIIMEGMWTYNRLPNPTTYNWENVCYSYHWYNFSPLNKTDEQFDLYYAYEDIFMMGRDYEVPIYIGEFSLFEAGSEDATYSRWSKGLELFESRHYSWSLWTYKKYVNGWWGDSWGIYNLNAASKSNPVETNANPYKVKVNLSTATKAEIDEAFSYENIGTDSCNKSVMYNVLTKYCNEHK